MTEFVKKQDVIDALNIISDKMDDDGQAVMRQAADIVKDVVPADVRENVHGEWEEIKTGSGVFDYQFKCTKCGGIHPKGYVVAPDYCAFCGADMRKKDKED